MTTASTQPALGAPVPGAREAASRAGGLPRRSALLILAGSLPLVAVALVTATVQPGYQCFPLAVLAGSWLAWRGWRALAEDLVPGTRVGTALLLGAAFFLALIATLLWSIWAGVLAALLAVVGLAWWAGGWPAVRAVLPGLLLVALATPPPLAIDRAVLGWVGAKSVSAASHFLHALTVPHFVSGQALEVPGRSLPMEAMRSLVNTVPAVVAFAWFYAAWWRRSFWRGCLGMAAGAAFAVFVATLTVVFAVRGSFADGVDLFAGARGWLLVLGGAIVSCGLAASGDQLLQFLLAPAPTGAPQFSVLGMRSGPGPRVWPKAPALGAAQWGAWAFAALGLVQVPLAGLYLWHELVPPASLVARLPSGAGFKLTEVTEPWVATPMPSALFPTLQTNAAARGLWFFDRGNLTVAVGLEYPVRAGESFTAPYERAGWRVVAQSHYPAAADGVPPWMDGLMQKDLVQLCGYWVGVGDEAGRWLAPPPPGPWLLAPFQARVRGPVALRVSVLAAGKEPFTAADREELTGLFETVRASLGRQFTAQLRAP